jgi:predicted proteasome-type protease
MTEHESHTVDINTGIIENAFQELITELNNKVFKFTKMYWKYVYLDRFFKGVIGIISMVSVMILSFDVITNEHVNDMISIYIVHSLLLTNLVCVIIMSSLQIRVKCVYYNTILKLYSNRLAQCKKKLADPMTKEQIQNLYEKIMMQINTIEQYEDSHKAM